jgi:hypothetical protein
VLSVLFSGCTYYHVFPGALEPSRAQIAPQQRVVLWQRAVGVLLDQGYVPQVLNEQACFISAKHRDDVENDPLSQTLALVYISPEGALRVEVTGVGYFSSEKEFISAIGERQRMIFERIVNGSGGPP